MKQFEYKLLERQPPGIFNKKNTLQNLETELNELGKQGWEIVNVARGGLFSAGSNSGVIILKREIQA
jgi:hypothetical protein